MKLACILLTLSYFSVYQKKKSTNQSIDFSNFARGNTPCIPLMQPKLLRHRLMQNFTKVRGEWGTVISLLQVLILGCLGRNFVGKQSKDAFSVCHK